MVVSFDLQKLTRALSDFRTATGININFMDEELRPIGYPLRASTDFCRTVQNSPEGKQRCCQSDCALLRKCAESGMVERHTCHAGLIDVAVPIVWDDQVVGHLILGQMKSSTDFDQIFPLLSGLELDRDQMKACYNRLRVFSEEHVQSVANVAIMLTKYILLNDIFHPTYDRNVIAAANYIRSHLDGEILISELCESIHVSKSVLYKSFRRYLNCTVNEYIQTERVKRARWLILNHDMSMEEISRQVGFSELSYFCKIFKKVVGQTPLQYKKLRGNTLAQK